MRLGMHRSRIHIFPRKRCKGTVILLLILVCLVFTYISCVFLFRVQPVFLIRASSYAHNIAEEAINESITQVFDDEFVSYGDLMDIKYDDNGNAVSIAANVSKINNLKSKIASAIQNNVSKNDYGEIAIPLGSVLENDIFQGLGPNISVSVAPFGITKVDFDDEFVAAGINQVRHKIYLNAEVTVSLISSTMEKTETVDSRILIAETVIVGNIPNYYSDSAPIAAITNQEQ